MTSPLKVVSPPGILGPRPMHLRRGADVFITETARWLVACELANVSGSWTPLGTNERNPDNRQPDGRYFPGGQAVVAADALALADGLRTALRTVPGANAPEFRNGVNRKAHMVDGRLFDRDILPFGPVLVWDSAQALDLLTGDWTEHLARFLDGGAFTIEGGVPAQVERERREGPIERKRRESLTREKERLVRAVASGTLTEDEAGPMLEDVRRQLQFVGAGPSAA